MNRDVHFGGAFLRSDESWKVYQFFCEQSATEKLWDLNSTRTGSFRWFYKWHEEIHENASKALSRNKTKRASFHFLFAQWERWTSFFCGTSSLRQGVQLLFDTKAELFERCHTFFLPSLQ